MVNIPDTTPQPLALRLRTLKLFQTFNGLAQGTGAPLRCPISFPVHPCEARFFFRSLCPYASTLRQLKSQLYAYLQRVAACYVIRSSLSPGLVNLYTSNNLVVTALRAAPGCMSAAARQHCIPGWCGLTQQPPDISLETSQFIKCNPLPAHMREQLLFRSMKQ